MQTDGDCLIISGALEE